jgi:transcriptional regulator of acetoin/glycerol metabolism
MSTALITPQNMTTDDPSHDEEILRLVSQLAQGHIAPLKVARRTAVRWALAHSEGNVSQAAEMLGISRGTIYRYARP